MSMRNLARLAVLGLIALGVALVAHYHGSISAEAVQARLDNLGAWAPLALIGLWLVAPVLLVPGGPLTLAGGALFGPVLGTVYSLIGATGGATLAFLLARYTGAEWVQRRARGRLARLKEGVEAEGWRFVAFVRLVPLFPFNLLNYALGLTRIRLAEYVLATAVCMLPGAAGYAYLGYAGREALLGARGWVGTGGIALGVLAALILLPWMARRWRARRRMAPATLAERLNRGEPLQVLDVRSPEEYFGPEGHIEPSTLIPLDQLGARLGELEPYRDRPIVVACRTERRSRRGVEMLAAAGFPQTYLLSSGMQGWTQAGLPVRYG